MAVMGLKKRQKIVKCGGCDGRGEVYSNNAWMTCPHCSGTGDRKKARSVR